MSAAVKSYEKHGDWKRAAAQGAASIGLNLATGFGAGHIAQRVFGSKNGVGRYAIELHGAPVGFAGDMSLEAGVDWLFDQANR